MKRRIDFTTEMGEGFSLPPFGLPIEFWRKVRANGERIHERQFMRRFDDALMPHVSSASLACGLHSGDPAILASVAAQLVERGVRIGAHPSYPDAFHFGQKRIDMARVELEAVIVYQLGAVGAIARAAGTRLQHVWCHGALGFDVSYDEYVCEVMIGAIRKYDPDLTLRDRNFLPLRAARCRRLRPDRAAERRRVPQWVTHLGLEPSNKGRYGK